MMFNDKIYIIVNIETDGPVIGKNSIVCFGAVVLDDLSLYPIKMR